MSADQYAVFMRYWGMGSERSLEALREVMLRDDAESTPKKVPAIDTLKTWSRKFGWQALIERMDEEANERLFNQAMSAARETRIDILKIFRAVVLRFATQLRDDKDRPITSADIATFWKMARVEMNLPTDRPDITSGGGKIGGFIYQAPSDDGEEDHDDPGAPQAS